MERCAAFTLVELIAVMVVTAVLAAVAIPSVGALTSTQQRAAANALRRDLTYARERAAATGVRTWVTFTTSPQSYSVLAESPASPGRAGAAVVTDPATSTAFTRRLGTGEYAGATFGSIAFDSDNEVGFDRLGQPLRSNGSLRTADGLVSLNARWRVRVAARTGLATVEALP